MAASPHVLLVADACVNALVISRILNGDNIRVTHGAGPKEALAFLDVVNDVKLVLTDYHMHNMSGYDFLREVKGSPRLEHIFVVIAFDDYTPEEFEKCFNAGAAESIHKPVDVTDVPRILSYIL